MDKHYQEEEHNSIPGHSDQQLSERDHINRHSSYSHQPYHLNSTEGRSSDLNSSYRRPYYPPVGPSSNSAFIPVPGYSQPPIQLREQARYYDAHGRPYPLPNHNNPYLIRTSNGVSLNQPTHSYSMSSGSSRERAVGLPYNVPDYGNNGVRQVVGPPIRLNPNSAYRHSEHRASQHPHLHQSQQRRDVEPNSSGFSKSELELEVKVNPLLKFTSFPIFPSVSTKNVTSAYGQGDNNLGYDPSSINYNLPYVKFPDGQEFEADLSRNCIILHPGSKNLRLGYATDPFPKQIPNCIARLCKQNDTELEENDSNYHSEELEEKFTTAVAWAQDELLDNLQKLKRKPVANPSTQIKNFNSTVEPTILNEHNDPYRYDFIVPDFKSDKVAQYYIGEQTEKLDNSENRYKLRYPIKYGTLNFEDYSTKSELRADLETIWKYAITELLKLNESKFEYYCVGVVVPDRYCPIYLSEVVDVLLQSLGFFSVFLIQESVAATFGAGLSSACVVDVGATVTTVACVDEGQCLPSSMISLPYGGDDVTHLLTDLLLQSSFPYPELDLNTTRGFCLADAVKCGLLTYNVVDMGFQLSQFVVSKPNCASRKYEFKVYDEGLIAPLLYFNPIAMDVRLSQKQKLIKRGAGWTEHFVVQWVDGMLGKNSVAGNYLAASIRNTNLQPTTNLDDETNYDDDIEATLANLPDINDPTKGHLLTDQVKPIHRAILDSISAISANDEHLARRMYSTILVVGGGAAIVPGFPNKLKESLVDTLTANTKSGVLNLNVDVLATVRELDPRQLPWKGASVLSKLEVLSELTISFDNWKEHGIHILRDKVTFMAPLPF